MTILQHPTKGTVDISGVEWTNPGGGTVQYAMVDRTEPDGTVERLHLMRSGEEGADGTILLFDQGEWDAFVAGARDGEFDPETFATEDDAAESGASS